MYYVHFVPTFLTSFEEFFAYSFETLLPSAVIDTLRMIVLHPDGASLLFQHVRAENGTESEIYHAVLLS